MINTLRTEYNHLLASPFLTKKEDLGAPVIECTIGQRIFHNTFCDIGSSVNIMSKVTYDYLFGDEPLFPTYMKLQMVDQSIRFSETSKRHQGQNTRSLCPCQLYDSWHGRKRRRRHTYYPWKTIPQHHKHDHLHRIGTNPLLILWTKGMMLFQ